VCDPPYHLTQVSRKGSARQNNPETPHGRTKLGSTGFMGKTWDGGDIAFRVNLWNEVYRVLKPGAYLLAFGGTRTYHRMACAIEDAGFEIRDQIQWIYGSGFPKSKNIGNGQGTALKPANEPICMARKPLEKGLTVEQNVAKWGTGAINIDACRVEVANDDRLQLGGTYGPDRKNGSGMFIKDGKGTYGREGEASADKRYNENGGTNFALKPGTRGGDTKGRWPANVMHDGSDEVVACFPNQTSGANPTRRGSPKFRNTYGTFDGQEVCEPSRGAEAGSASRFFYSPKASKYDREAGLPEAGRDSSRNADQPSMNGGDGNPYNRGVTTVRNHHPTVKPTELMQYLVRLVTPPNGLILDPFLGSGSTAKAALIESFNIIGIEIDPEYVAIAEARCRTLQVKLF